MIFFMRLVPFYDCKSIKNEEKRSVKGIFVNNAGHCQSDGLYVCRNVNLIIIDIFRR